MTVDADTRYGENITDWHSWQEGRRYGHEEAMAGFPRFVMRLWWRLIDLRSR